MDICQDIFCRDFLQFVNVDNCAVIPRHPGYTLAAVPSKGLLLIMLSGALSEATALDLSKAVIVAPSNLSSPEKKAVTMLVEEVQKRTQIRWPIETSWPQSAPAVVAIGRQGANLEWPDQYRKELRQSPSANAAEGFQIQSVVNNVPPAVLVLGNDARGELFGVGRLLRALHLTRAAPRSMIVLTSRLRQSIRCAGINSATGPRPIP